MGYQYANGSSMVNDYPTIDSILRKDLHLSMSTETIRRHVKLRYLVGRLHKIPLLENPLLKRLQFAKVSVQFQSYQGTCICLKRFTYLRRFNVTCPQIWAPEQHLGFNLTHQDTWISSLKQRFYNKLFVLWYLKNTVIFLFFVTDKQFHHFFLMFGLE